MLLAKAWTAINRLSIIWKSDLSNKMKHNFFQAAVMSILRYRCTTWTLTKHIEKKLDGNFPRMLRAILNIAWKRHPTKQQLYGHLPLSSKTAQIRQMRHVGHCQRSKDKLMTFSYGPLHIDMQVLADQQELIYNGSVWIQDVVLKAGWKWRKIERNSERKSGKTMPAVQHDDDGIVAISDPRVVHNLHSCKRCNQVLLKIRGHLNRSQKVIFNTFIYKPKSILNLLSFNLVKLKTDTFLSSFLYKLLC